MRRSLKTAFAPDGFEHEPLRLIVRRVAVSCAEIQAANPKARRRSTIPADQLAIVLDGQLASTYAYSFIATDIPDSDKSTVQVEHDHRQRAQIKERFKTQSSASRSGTCRPATSTPTASGSHPACWR